MKKTNKLLAGAALGIGVVGIYAAIRSRKTPQTTVGGRQMKRGVIAYVDFAYSGPSWAAIPVHRGQRFRFIVGTHFGAT
ncbi:MAG: hypothetical protein ACRD6N_11120 [Pyrinomonadaceae bacterium]